MPTDKSRTTPSLRHKDIFPPGFDKKNSGSRRLTSASPYAFRPDQLYVSLIDRCSPTSLADTIIVTFAWYGKRTKSKLAHEFLLFEVKDIANEGYINYVILDRHASGISPGTTARLPRSQSYSTSCRADDQFRVAYDGDSSRLMLDCSLKSCQLLEKLEFSLENPFYFYELVTLANVVSELHPGYNVADSNSFLYTGLIWECMLQTYPDAPYESDRSERRGRFACIRYCPRDDAKKLTYGEFQRKLPTAREQIEKAQRLKEQVEGAQ